MQTGDVMQFSISSGQTEGQGSQRQAWRGKKEPHCGVFYAQEWGVSEG